jgi:hypothetical protein
MNERPFIAHRENERVTYWIVPAASHARASCNEYEEVNGFLFALAFSTLEAPETVVLSQFVAGRSA